MEHPDSPPMINFMPETDEVFEQLDTVDVPAPLHSSRKCSQDRKASRLRKVNFSNQVYPKLPPQ